MIQSVFEAAAVAHPEMHSPTSRAAMYGVDVMLDTSFQPKLLEKNYMSTTGKLFFMLKIKSKSFKTRLEGQEMTRNGICDFQQRFGRRR
ncbi:tubulin--tyrosine ligase protein [Trifolium repens]|nr:tubulin--tyrosine ligase protein [Trifolium repens]